MRIYLDHNATTPLRPEVVDAMLPALREGYGNPSSTHEEGAAARRLVETARSRVAALFGAATREVVFTAGATEANNAVLASLRSSETPWNRLVTTQVEHPSVREPACGLEAEGVPVTWLGVDETGRVDIGELERDLAANGPALVSVIAANNETGVLAPLPEIGACVRAAGSFLHADVTQALGKTSLAEWAGLSDIEAPLASSVAAESTPLSARASFFGLLGRGRRGGGSELVPVAPLLLPDPLEPLPAPGQMDASVPGAGLAIVCRPM